MARGDLPVGVVGGGIVGLAIAREFTRQYPGIEVCVFEKEDELAAHQTGHNSGVVHAGIYYKPGSLKAELCTRGRGLIREFCEEHRIAYEQCGKLVVALDDTEVDRLAALQRTASANAVPGLRRVGGGQIQEIEPHAVGLAALHSPETAITDFVTIARAFADDVRTSGGEIRLACPVTAIRRSASAIEVTTPSGVHQLSQLVLCAGLQSDRVARQVDGPSEPRIIPFRGEYMDVNPEKRDLVRGLIYPVPDPQYPFLGVHFTRRVSGVVDIGPNAVLGFDREAYGRFGFDFDDVRDTASWPGFWRMAREHWRTGAKEMLGSLSARAYMRNASRYVPEIGSADVVRGTVGIRAQAVDRDGSLVDDFRIHDDDGIISIRNAPSPAATSSLAIAQHVLDLVARK